MSSIVHMKSVVKYTQTLVVSVDVLILRNFKRIPWALVRLTRGGRRGGAAPTRPGGGGRLAGRSVRETTMDIKV